MSKTLPVTGMTFSKRSDNYNECLNTKAERNIQNLFPSISIYYNKKCLLQWKDKVLKKEKNMIQLKRVCAVKVISITWLSLGHPCYAKNEISYVTSTVPYSTWLIQMTVITFYYHFWWKVQNVQIR